VRRHCGEMVGIKSRANRGELAFGPIASISHLFQ
jgi:hypothetical protein